MATATKPEVQSQGNEALPNFVTCRNHFHSARVCRVDYYGDKCPFCALEAENARLASIATTVVFGDSVATQEKLRGNARAIERLTAALKVFGHIRDEDSSRIDYLKRVANNHRDAFKGQMATIDEQTAVIAAAQTENRRLSNLLLSATDRHSGDVAEIANLQEQVMKDLPSYGEVKEQAETIKALRAEIARLHHEHDERYYVIEKRRSQIDTLNAEAGDLCEKVMDLTNQVDELQAQVADLTPECGGGANP